MSRTSTQATANEEDPTEGKPFQSVGGGDASKQQRAPMHDRDEDAEKCGEKIHEDSADTANDIKYVRPLSPWILLECSDPLCR